MSTGVQPPAEESPVTEALRNNPVNVPGIPVGITMNVSSLYDVWQYADSGNIPEESGTLPVPKTVISPVGHLINHLVPYGIPSPLFEDDPESVQLRREFLLDYFVAEAIESSDKRMDDDGGLSVVNLNENTLLFKKEPVNGGITINGITVSESRLLKDGTWVYFINDLLFNHKEKVTASVLKNFPHVGGNLFVDTESSEGSGIEAKPVPVIPLAVDKEKATSLIHLWRHAVRNQKSAAAFEEPQVPKTVLSPSHMHVQALVPADAPHPLYNECSKNVALRSEMLRDYLLAESVSSDDLGMEDLDGLTVNNLNGKPVTFKKYSGGNMTVNGVDASFLETLSDGTQVYNLEDILFDHTETVELAAEVAFRNLTALLDELPESTTAPALPNIPESIINEHGSSLVYLWQYALNHQLLAAEGVPMTVLYPEYRVLANPIPPDNLQPLYDNKENAVLRNEFLLDYLVTQPIHIEDPRLSPMEGILVQNLRGKELFFRKDIKGKLTINGIAAKGKPAGNGVWTYGLDGFLFDHKERLDQAYNDMFGYFGGSDDLANTTDSPRSSSPELGPGVIDVVATLPVALLQETKVTMYTFWLSALDLQDEKDIARDDREPKTLLSPPIEKILTFTPFGKVHPLFDPENAALRREIVNDYLMLQFVGPYDDRFLNPDGVTFMNFNNKPIIFKRMVTGGLMVNNVAVSGIKFIRKGTLYMLYEIEDFLFDHEEKANQAIEEYNALHDRNTSDPCTVTVSDSVRPWVPLPMVMDVPPNPVPPIPYIVEGKKLTNLIHLWRHALDHQSALTTLKDFRRPMTILSPGSTAMNLVPPGAPHPLFDSSTPENAALRNEIILDYLALPVVNNSNMFNVDLSPFTSHSVTNLNDKMLNFTMNQSGKYVVNGIGVEHVLELEESNIVVYYLEDFLFDHRAKVAEAFEKLVHRTLTDNRGVSLLDRSSTPAIRETIPQIPDLVVKDRATSMIDLWRLAYRHQNPKRAEGDTRVPRTIISPMCTSMVNVLALVAERNAALRAQFVLDYLILVPINSFDPRMDTIEGLSVRNFNGRKVVFRKEYAEMTVNGLRITKEGELSDGTKVYSIDSLLFEHQSRIDRANEMLYLHDSLSERDPDSGTVTDRSSGSVSPLDPEYETVPSIPEMVKVSGLPAILDAWLEAVAFQGSSATARDGRVIKTLVSPRRMDMDELLLPERNNPLRDNSIDNVALRTKFLKDMIILGPIDMKDEVVQKPGGENYTNLNGKTMNFFKNNEGKLKINDVAVDSVNPLRDGTTVFIVEDFLFDHRAQLAEASQILKDRPSPEPSPEPELSPEPEPNSSSGDDRDSLERDSETDY